MGLSRWFKSDAQAPTGEPVVMSAAQAVAAVEAHLADALVLAPAGAGPAWALAAVEALWRQTAPGPLNAHSPREALATLLGLSLTGQRGAAVVGTESWSGVRELLQSAAAQGAPLVLHAVLTAGPAGGVHDAWQALEGTGAVQFLASDAQSAADLTLVARRVAEENLLPVVVGQHPFSAGCLEPLRLPTLAQVHAFLGLPEERIPTPTPAYGSSSSN